MWILVIKGAEPPRRSGRLADAAACEVIVVAEVLSLSDHRRHKRLARNRTGLVPEVVARSKIARRVLDYGVISEAVSD